MYTPNLKRFEHSYCTRKCVSIEPHEISELGNQNSQIYYARWAYVYSRLAISLEKRAHQV